DFRRQFRALAAASARRLTQPPLHVPTLRRKLEAQYFRRMWLGRIFNSVRYFATVRRAMGMPRSPRISTISLSLRGALPASFFTRSRIASLTLVLLIETPVEVW